MAFLYTQTSAFVWLKKKISREGNKSWKFKLSAYVVFLGLCYDLFHVILMVSSKLQTKNRSCVSVLDLSTEVKINWIQLEYSSFCKALCGKHKPVGMKFL